MISYAEIAHTVGYYYPAKTLVTLGFTLIGIGFGDIEDGLVIQVLSSKMYPGKVLTYRYHRCHQEKTIVLELSPETLLGGGYIGQVTSSKSIKASSHSLL